MSTIALIGNSLNCRCGISGFPDVSSSFSNAISSSQSLAESFSKLKNKIDIAQVGANVSNTQQSVEQANINEETKISSLTVAYDKLDQLITDTGKIDNQVSEIISNREDDLYKEYSYLKPDCKKSKKERRHEKWAEMRQNFKDFWCGVGSAIINITQNVGDWCKEHWKAVITGLILVIAVVGLVVLSLVTGGGILVAIIAGACWGAISGAVIGGIFGGINSKKNGVSFWEGVENGAFSGVISGAIGGAVTGGLTAAFGPATTMFRSVLRGAGTGAFSTSTSNMAVTAMDIYATNGTLKGATNKILQSGISGVVSGALVGGVMGGVQFKITEAIKAYTGNNCYRNINDSLRQLDTLDDANVSTVKYMHKGLRHSSLPDDMTLYRGTSIDALENLKGFSTDELIGKQFIEKGFMSTSTTSSVANNNFSGNLQLIINAPKGSQGLNVSNISYFANENEILFDYGQKMLITGAEYIDDILNLNVDIIT